MLSVARPNSYWSKAMVTLNNLISEGKITAAGVAFLRQALDPFHDTPIPIASGWPDGISGSSVVREITQTRSWSLPSAGPLGPYTDLVFMLNQTFDVNGNYQNTAVRQNNLLVGNTTVGTVGGVTVWALTPGAAFVPGGSTGCVLLGVLGLDPSYSQGVHRCVGVGFEVANTTAPLYMQGACTVFRVNANMHDPSFYLYTDASGVLHGFFNGTQYPLPASNTAQWMLYPGAQTWQASAGCYIVGSFLTNENPPYDVDYNVPLYTQFSDTLGVNNTTPVWFPAPTAPTPVADVFGTQATHQYPIHCGAAWFSGLSQQTTLQLNLKFFIETFPTTSQLNILTLAKPSTSYDPLALEILSRCAKDLPVGVDFNSNPFGEWLCDVVNDVSQALSAIPVPWTQSAGAVGQKLSKAMRPILVSGPSQVPTTQVPANPPLSVQKMKTKKKRARRKTQVQPAKRGPKPPPLPPRPRK